MGLLRLRIAPRLAYSDASLIEGTANMDFIRNMQTKDWVIAGIAFVVGAIIF